MPRFEVVETHFPGRSNWYARVTRPDGGMVHSEPWNSRWAATRCAVLMQRAWALSKRTSTGSGDPCPLYEDHGQMNVLTTDNKVPMQWCPHVIHDGAGPALADGTRPIPSRSFWPFHGFAESRDAYFARLDRAVREASPADLPDLGSLEVK